MGKLIKCQQTAVAQASDDTLTIDRTQIALPPDPGQIAIGTVLAGTNPEITTLEARRDNTCALKQGMMQELLTGRVHLV